MAALRQFQFIPPSTPDSLHRYELVQDAYGPGTFLVWLLGTYALVFQLFFKTRNRTAYRALDKDIFIILSYPVFAADHLVKLVSHYPGAQEKIWWTTSKYLDRQIVGEDLQAAMPIQAASRVCFAALAFNIVILLKVRGKWQTLSKLAASN